MKILSLTYEYLPIGGGGSRVAAAINEELVRMGHEVTVLTSAMHGLPATETVGGVVVHRSPCVRRYSHYTTAAELVTTLMPTYRRASELIRDERPEVIHTHFILPSGLIAWALSQRFRVPYVLTAHGSDVPGYNPDRFHLLHNLLRPVWRRILKGAASVTSPSRFLAKLMHLEGCQVPVTVVPNGHWPLKRLGEERRNRILLVSRLFPRKGIQHFIDAVSDMQHDWEMIVAGDGPYRAELEARARQKAPKVLFVGFVNAESLRILYESSRILVFPSIQENFPMVLLEAMDAGCAVVTANAEGCSEVVGHAGIVVPKGNPKGIREALDQLLADPALVEDLSARGIARAGTLAWPRIVPRYAEILDSAISTSSVLERRALAR
ncbi:MAG: glycosyltransferase family 4 protein [Steroidobacteraceae bacterium]